MADDPEMGEQISDDETNGYGDVLAVALLIVVVLLLLFLFRDQLGLGGKTEVDISDRIEVNAS